MTILTILSVMIFCLLIVGTIYKIFSDYRKSAEQMMDRQETQAQEAYQLANSVASAMTEATTRLSESQQNWMATMYLGRESTAAERETLRQEQESGKPEIPGIDNLEGLPDSIRSVIEREETELARLSKMPSVPYEMQSNGNGTTPDLDLSQRAAGWITE